MLLQSLSNSILLSNFKIIVQQERRVSREVLEHIAEIEKRRLYADDGFASTHEWLVKVHHYSHASAGRRANAARMIAAIPEAAAKVEAGELCMTDLSRVQSSIRAEEKRSGRVATADYKAGILEKIESQPKTELEKSLADIFQVRAPRRNVVEPKCSGESRVHLTFSAEQMQNIERAAELLSHKTAGTSLSVAIAEMAAIVIRMKDPLVKRVKPRARKAHDARQDRSGQGGNSSEPSAKASAASSDQMLRELCPANSAAVPPATRNAVYCRDRGCCQFASNEGVRCLSREFTQIDHILPRAFGGSNELRNLRVLCRTHNLLMAERVFGKEKIKRERELGRGRKRSSKKCGDPAAV